MIFDSSGNLYGTYEFGGTGGGGIVYELVRSGGGWNFVTLYNLVGQGGPLASLTIDAAGNLYGTASSDGQHGCGAVFKLVPSGGNWTYTSLHDFDCSDGAYPASNVSFDADGNLYGTTANGGAYNDGTVWEITP